MNWLIWSREHQAFWKKPEYGYTPEISQAGRFTWERALQILDTANLIQPEEFLLPAPEDL